jgi:hypothetical protein
MTSANTVHGQRTERKRRDRGGLASLEDVSEEMPRIAINKTPEFASL